MKKVEANFLSSQPSNLASTISLEMQRWVSGPCDSDPFVTVFRPLDEPNSSPCLEDGTADSATEPVSEVTEVFKDPAPSPLMLDRFESIFSGPEIRCDTHLAPFAGPGSSKASPDSVLGPSPSTKARKEFLTATEQWFSCIKRETKSRLSHGYTSQSLLCYCYTHRKIPASALCSNLFLFSAGMRVYHTQPSKINGAPIPCQKEVYWTELTVQETRKSKKLHLAVS